MNKQELKITIKDYLKIKVIPNSSKNQITEIMEESNGDKIIKIRIKAAPKRGKANKELIKFLSKHLKLSKSCFSIISGKTEQIKLIKIKT